MDFISKFYRSGTFRIHYQCGGEGTPALLIHGYGEDGNIWKTVLNGFEGLQLIIPDFPGFGQSDVAESYALKEMMKVFLEIMDAEGIERFYILGHSMGGYTTSEFVASVPDRLLGIGMIHTHPFGDTNEIKVNRKKREDHIQAYGTSGFLKEFYPILFGTQFTKEHPEVVEEMRTYGMTLHQKAFIAGMQAMRLRPNHSESFKHFERPVLFVVGDDDKAVPYELCMKQLSLPQIADVQILKDIGHMSMLEDTEVFVRILKNYFKFSHQMADIV
jgi:pimeloyl-ACP methyl ester carboxylesterase